MNIFSLKGQLYGIEKFWAFQKYYKHADKLNIDPRLKEHLSKFKTVEDFRVLEPQINEMLEGVGSLRQSPDKRRHRSISESEGVAIPRTSINRTDVTIGRNDNYNRKRFENYIKILFKNSQFDEGDNILFIFI